MTHMGERSVAQLILNLGSRRGTLGSSLQGRFKWSEENLY